MCWMLAWFHEIFLFSKLYENVFADQALGWQRNFFLEPRLRLGFRKKFLCHPRAWSAIVYDRNRNFGRNFGQNRPKRFGRIFRSTCRKPKRRKNVILTNFWQFFWQISRIFYQHLWNLKENFHFYYLKALKFPHVHLNLNFQLKSE